MVAANDLRVHLVNPRMETVGGTTRLVVQGVVVNTSSEQTRGVPPLTAAVRSAGGEVLREWSFETGMNELEPGASVPFETALENPPTGTQTVNVGFSPSLSARN